MVEVSAGRGVRAVCNVAPFFYIQIETKHAILRDNCWMRKLNCLLVACIFLFTQNR